MQTMTSEFEQIQNLIRKGIETKDDKSAHTKFFIDYTEDEIIHLIQSAVQSLRGLPDIYTPGDKIGKMSRPLFDPSTNPAAYREMVYIYLTSLDNPIRMLGELNKIQAKIPFVLLDPTLKSVPTGINNVIYGLGDLYSFLGRFSKHGQGIKSKQNPFYVEDPITQPYIQFDTNDLFNAVYHMFNPEPFVSQVNYVLSMMRADRSTDPKIIQRKRYTISLILKKLNDIIERSTDPTFLQHLLSIHGITDYERPMAKFEKENADMLITQFLQTNPATLPKTGTKLSIVPPTDVKLAEYIRKHNVISPSIHKST
jgi:hypothetical protein